ncbi:MAG: mechanosensitive ion channel family protein [Phycisphaerae bacterium]
MIANAFLNTEFLENQVWQWLALLGTILGSLMVGKATAFILERQGTKLEEGGKPLFGRFLKSLGGPIAMIALAAGLYFAASFMTLKYSTVDVVTKDGEEIKTPVLHDVTDFWINVCKTIAVLAAGWFIFKLVDLVEYFLQKWTSKTDTLLDDQLVPLLRKSLRVFVVIVTVLFIAQNIFRWDIGALIAGLGLGGLAFALAAKDMLANLFGSVTIFADRPFQMGERIQVVGKDGIVEEVGFRSTRIRTLDGNLVIVPNSIIANEAIENISRRPFIKKVMNVTVTYDTPPQKVQEGVDIIKELLDERRDSFHPDFPSRVYFSDYNDASLNIVIYMYFAPPDWWEYLAFCHDFNMALLERYNAAGIEFAFPTQTLYLKQDSQLEASIRTIGGNEQ